MSRSSRLWSPADIEALAVAGGQVVTRRVLRTVGVSDASIAHQLERAGGWTWLLPGTYLLRRGTPTWSERAGAALAYAGDAAVLTGRAALHLHGLGERPEQVDVLVPHAQRRRDARGVRVERCRRMPEPVVVRGLACAPVARGLADACRTHIDPRSARALVAAAVQRGLCTVAALRSELEAGPVRHSALLRSILAEVGSGVRSVAEADARSLLLDARLPEPCWNVDLLDGEGRFLARPDAYWPDAGVAWEIDSKEWHTSPEDWARTVRRHGELTSRGVLVLHTLPSRLRKEPGAVVREVARALRTGSAAPAPDVVPRVPAHDE